MTPSQSSGRFMLDWSVSLKCSVTILLQAGLELLLLLWKYYVVNTPNTQTWLNIDVVRQQFIYDSAIFVGCLLLAITALLFKRQQTIMRVMPYICAWFIALVMSYQAHLIGTLTPLTGIMLIGLTILGLLLFGRWVTYPAVACAVMLLGVSTVLSLSGVCDYAPLFKHPVLPAPTDALMWLSSIAWLACPMTIGILILLDRIIEQWKINADEVWRLSQTDALTGVYNRHFLAKALQQQASQPHVVSICLLDIDHFKRINDQCGHVYGDRVLQDVAQCLKDHTRDHDWVGRFGGEEFLLVMPHMSSADAASLVERCRTALHVITVKNTQDEHWHISASFGVVTVCGPFDVSTILSQVDGLMYQSKHQGRNRASVLDLSGESSFTPSSSESSML